MSDTTQDLLGKHIDLQAYLPSLFWDRVLLYRPDGPWICDPPASAASYVLRWQVIDGHCLFTGGFYGVFE